MTIEDVVKLIEACKNTGISKLKFEKLELQFLPKVTDAIVTESTPDTEHTRRAIQQQIERDADLQDLEAQNLMISDPVAYEASLIRK